MSRPWLGIDIGGTKTHGILLAADGDVLAESIRPTTPGPEGVVAAALAVTDACLALAGRARPDLGSVGVGIPGQVDHSSGVVRTAVNLGIDHLALGARLEAGLGVDVRVDNDVKAAALGAASRLGAVDLSFLNLGTGVAAATVAGGRVVRGEGNLAGEIGHVPVAPDGELCACGQRGCLEAEIGGGRVAARLAGLAPGVSLGTLFEAADAGHRDAAAEAGRLTTGTATAVQLLVLAQGSARVVLGGGVVHTATGLVAAVRRELAARAGASAFLASLDLPGRVGTLPAEYPVAAIGAALVGRAGQPAPAPAAG